MAENNTQKSAIPGFPPFQMPNFPQMPGFPQMPAFDPAAFGFGPMIEAWTKANAEQQARMVAMMDEYAKAEEKAVVEAKRAVEEMARLSVATIDYAREVSVNMRKQALEMSKKAAETTQVEKKAEKK